MRTRPHVLIIVSSTRPNANGPAIGSWVEAELVARGDVTTAVADLAAVGLPLLDEPHHPSKRRYLHDHTHRWSGLVDAADGFVFITPEYNRGMPGSLKNALDYLHEEWRHKPAAFVSYSGGVSGGTRAVEMAKQTMTALAMWPITEMVNIPRIDSHFGPAGFTPPVGAAGALSTMVDSLVAHISATCELRAIA